ncbi:BA75_04588T0 [Komagataella pastoris]|uniref:RNA helicase n=1 Tax=Komagataella pastoris TaxID=4922 RepID=A0A1B2JI83_PICPA|nr:BA75_04588T0 [Komagataella pastoris]
MKPKEKLRSKKGHNKQNRKEKFKKSVAKPKSVKKNHTGKLVSASSLNWKPVEIPETLDDFQGLFGVEEIDGVGVVIKDGEIKFEVKEDHEDGSVKDTDQMSDDDDIFQDAESLDGREVDQNEPENLGSNSASTETVSKSTSGVISNKKAKQKKQDKENKKDEDQEDAESDLISMEEEGEGLFKFSQMKIPEDVDLPLWPEGLSPFVRQSLSILGFREPTPIQSEAIPLAISGKDIIGKAITGSGKTLAYGIPLIEKYLTRESRSKQAPPAGIVFAPTRELAHQVVKHLKEIAKDSPLTEHGVISVTGGLSIQRQQRLLDYGPGIIVATPGRFLELLESSNELATRLASVEVLVLDEADRLLQDGHFDELEKILSSLKKMRPQNIQRWQTLVFSATFSKELFGKLGSKYRWNEDQGLAEDEQIIELLGKRLRFRQKPTLVDTNPTEVVTNQVREALIECGATERDLHLYYFMMMYPGTTLVFANSIDAVRRLVPFLQNLGIPAFGLHSSMIQKQRLRAIERFTQASKSNNHAVLIATDVAARGLDISGIQHVVHYHLPRTADTYVHRTGRTGRAGKEGVAVILCSPKEASGPLRRLKRALAKTAHKKHTEEIQLLPIDQAIMSQLNPRVQLAAQLADATVTSDGARKEKDWVRLAAEELGVDDLDNLQEDDYLKRDRKRREGKTLSQKEMNQARNKLEQLLKTTIRKDSRRSYLTGGSYNLADVLLKGKGHQEIVGQEKVDVLTFLKKKAENKKKSSKT